MLRLKSVETENIREERPVLTERGESTEGANTLPEDEGERTEETSSSRTKGGLEKSQGIYASEASRPMTLEEMFEQQREEERNTPEFLAKAEESYQERKRWWIEHCRIKGIPHELETEPETLPPSEVARLKEKTKKYGKTSMMLW